MTLHLSLIVEGQTEQQCVERLLQRVWRELLNAPERLNVLSPSRTKRDAFLQTDSEAFVKKIEEASIKLATATRRETDSRGSLFILLDAERACPRALAPRVLAAAQAARRDIDIACVFANRQFENWIVAGSSTLSWIQGLPIQIEIPDDCESIDGETHLVSLIKSESRRRTYKKTVDSLPLVSKMNVEDCRRRSPSFDKLCRELAKRQLLRSVE